MIARDDFFTLIHKTLRYALFSAASEAGRIDWLDSVQVQDFRARWDETVALVGSHAKHEDMYIWPLLEAKRPGAVAELGIGHEAVDADIAAVDAEFTAMLHHPGPATGLTFYRALTRFIAHALNHFASEEPAVMEMMWAMCTDDELARCRAAFMADIPPSERAATLRLMIESNSSAELLDVLGSLRASMPPGAYESWLGGLEDTMSPTTYARLTELAGKPERSSV